jgi:hypothetical protein
MSLPSQSARGGVRATSVATRRRRKSPVRSAVPFLIVAVLVVIVWFTVRPTGGGRTDEPVVPPAVSESAPTPGGASTPRPMEITQGGQRRMPADQSPVVPPRTLPGAQEPAQDEVDRALASTPSQTPVESPTSSPSDGSDGILTRALEEPARPATQPTTQAAPPTVRPGEPASRVRVQIDTARRLASENDRVGARALLSRVLRDPGLTAAEANLLRDELTVLNEQLIFGRVVDRADPITEEYTVGSGDSLSRIAGRRELATHWKLIQRVNGLSDPTKIRLDQKLKLVRGPFHAVVDKSDFRMDVWHGPPSDPSRWVYIRSFDVGLGEGGGTPTGTFVVSVNKLENPGWVNPRDSRERYEPNDPKNPIGEFWLGLDGVGASQGVTGYGIHGTIDPSSVGANMSMGCVRLRDEDIALVFELLAERVSVVEIVP